MYIKLNFKFTEMFKLSDSPDGYLGAVSLEIKQLGHEADHLLPLVAEGKNMWNCISTPPYIFMPWCLIKYRDNFTFVFHPGSYSFPHSCKSSWTKQI
jgi:hypothetical protein